MFVEAALIILGITAIACLSLSKIKSWLRGRTNTKVGDLTKRELEDGRFEVVVIGLNEYGSQTGEKTYRTRSLDPELSAEFGYSNHTRIYV